MANTTISIDEETRDELKQHGVKGDTYDDILNKLMEQVDE